jgi:UDP-N-acetylmuramyl-tripeptide synthetase
MSIRKLVPDFITKPYHLALAFLGALFFWFPSKKIKVIGITGTNGKSTVVQMLSHVLRKAGFKVASLSSIEFRIGDKVIENKTRMTMPGRFFVQKLLAQAVQDKCQYFVMEITSQGVEQYRHAFINFDCAIITNLTPEHIEAHKGFENYKNAKGKFFASVKNTHIVNLDDNYHNYFLSFDAKQKIGYTLQNNSASNTKIVSATKLDNSKFTVQDQEFNLKMFGDYNIYNALAVISYCLNQNISLKVCADALANLDQIPGRGEIVISEPFKVCIDYAFTPNALEQVYKTLKPAQCKMIAVLGSAGGGRDKWKRPVLGELADKYCDIVIVTNEDPFNEDPQKIIDMVASGVKNKQPYKILDRREAIKFALSQAQAGDVVIITGKGSEPSIVQKGKRIPWSDKGVAEEEFKKQP